MVPVPESSIMSERLHEQQEERRAAVLAITQVVSPTPDERKKLVHWKDETTDDLDHEEHDRIDTSSVHDDADGEDVEMTCCKKIAQADVSTKSSPRTRLSRQELQQLLRKQQAAIRHACQLELSLLNKSAQVRQKRMRMVQRLQRMQRKLEGKTSNASETFLLPPVFQQTKNNKPTAASSCEIEVIDLSTTACSSSSDESSSAEVPVEE